MESETKNAIRPIMLMLEALRLEIRASTLLFLSGIGAIQGIKVNQEEVAAMKPLTDPSDILAQQALKEFGELGP